MQGTISESKNVMSNGNENTNKINKYMVSDLVMLSHKLLCWGWREVIT